MKSIIIIAVTCLIVIAFPGSSKVVINEVELDPPGDDDDNEWVELYNSGDKEVDISGWMLLATHGSPECIKIRPNTQPIPPSGFCVIVGEGQWLDNEIEVVTLENEMGVEIDRTPCLSDNDNSHCAWSRFPDGNDTDTNFEWGFMDSTIGKRASGDICYIGNNRVHFALSGSVEGDISTIKVTPSGRLATLSQSYYTNIDDRDSRFYEHTTALEGHYSSDAWPPFVICPFLP